MGDVACPPRIRFRAAARTHEGCVRALNEDRILVRTGAGLWAVADGMGGHRAGEVAASRLVEALDRIEPEGSGYQRLQRLIGAAEQVNGELFRAARESRGGASGATMVLLLAHDGHFACVWAGDSRAYRLRDRRLEQVTHDHSVVQALIDRGEIAETARRTHPKVHMVTRAVGAAAELDLDRRFAEIAAADRFLLCSDGLTACVSDSELAERLEEGDPDQVADDLLELALQRGAPDNVSLIVISAEAAGL